MCSIMKNTIGQLSFIPSTQQWIRALCIRYIFQWQGTDIRRVPLIIDIYISMQRTKLFIQDKHYNRRVQKKVHTRRTDQYRAYNPYDLKQNRKNKIRREERYVSK